MHILQRQTGFSSPKLANLDMQAELCGKVRFRKQSPERLGFSRLEAMSKKTPNKLIVWGKSHQWKFKVCPSSKWLLLVPHEALPSSAAAPSAHEAALHS